MDLSLGNTNNDENYKFENKNVLDLAGLKF